MTLVEEIKKLKRRGYKDLDKDMVKMLDTILSYSGTFDMKTNYARLAYDREFDLCCREAEELNMDLWVHLSNKFKIPKEERYLIKPPDILKNKKEVQDRIKWKFWPFYNEWKLNYFSNPIIYAFSKNLVPLRKGGNKTVKKTKARSDAKHQQLIEKEKELIASGTLTPSNKRQHNTILAKALKFEYNFVQDFHKLQRRNENPKC